MNSFKSLYIVKRVFSLLYETKKLSLIIYNKSLQKKFGIDINYYKKVSGKYLILEKNGNGKEYKLNTNILIFEGQYQNGKKSGFGNEYYDNGKIKFEGKYLNGNKIKGIGFNRKGKIHFILNDNGKGKEIYNNKNIQFKGEYLNGKRWNGKGYDYNGKEDSEIKYGEGYIKDYSDFGELKFVGKYINGERWKGKKFNKYGYLKFDGEYLNGRKWKGKGKEYYENGNLKFDGEYKYGERNGRGKEYYIIGNLKFEGEYKSGKRNGKGKEFFNNDYLLLLGDSLYKNKIIKGLNYYSINILNGKRHGKGKEYYCDDNYCFDVEYNNGEKVDEENTSDEEEFVLNIKECKDCF